ncbi:MAG TPA: response regulator transcription factor [Fibrobacteraceae bacterium]|nr:response regulator transcription factor [Fibrobacteraceae bacterium]
MPRILFVDDHAVVRAGIMNLLVRAFPREELLEAGSYREAQEILQQGGISLVLCDISLGRESGLDLLQRYAKDARFVMLSIYDPEVYAHRCLELGAKAYLSKVCDPEELLQTMRRVMDEIPVPAQTSIHPMLDSLSTREREVLEDIVNGLTLQQISTKRHIQYPTVKTYKQRIMEKTHCKHNMELLFWALKNGVIAPTEMPVRGVE